MSGNKPREACATCRTLAGVWERDQHCADQLEADIALLNRYRAHIVGHGVDAGISRETIHALAAVVRAFLSELSSTPARRWRGGPR